MIYRLFFVSTNFFLLLLFTGCLPDQPDHIEPGIFFDNLGEAGIFPKPLIPENFPNLGNAVTGFTPLGVYAHKNVQWALFDLPRNYLVKTTLQHSSNLNLHIFSKTEVPDELTNSLKSLSPQIGYEQLGIFAYPLGICLVLSIFITLERIFSLRRGVTFPRKVEKALLRGEFPDKKWKRGSAAERIVHVAVKEQASDDTITAYARLEIAAMERGLFLLDVIIAGAPLIGLLGTVTGLVQVFSQMPAGGDIDHSLFSQGISLALLTTMAGLAITLPTIFFNSYLQRVLDKRAASLDWLSARLIDATARKKPPSDVIR
ncbi:MotA/TolQ/ExbB proton channel family protein [Opitutales bacterium]|nr:MotA/TolQ/ExbB proton channel family protein [Opitutales bacterium]